MYENIHIILAKMFRIPKSQVILFEFFPNYNSAIKIPKSIELIKKPPKCLSGFVSQWGQKIMNSYLNSHTSTVSKEVF